MRKRSIVIIISVIVLALLAVAGWYLASRPDAAIQTTTDQGTTAPGTTNQERTDEPAKTYPISVYFSKHPESDDDPSQTFPVRRVAPDLGVANFAMAELLKGPTASEADRGYFSYVRLRDDPSNCDGRDFKLSIENGIATLQFCRTFDHIGSVSDGQAESSIKTTLTNFDAIDRVVILNKTGDCEFDLSGENRCRE